MIQGGSDSQGVMLFPSPRWGLAAAGACWQPWGAQHTGEKPPEVPPLYSELVCLHGLPLIPAFLKNVVKLVFASLFIFSARRR